MFRSAAIGATLRALAASVDTPVQLMVEQRALDDWTSDATQVLGGAIGVGLIGGVTGLVVGLLKVVSEHDSLITRTPEIVQHLAAAQGYGSIQNAAD